MTYIYVLIVRLDDYQSINLGLMIRPIIVVYGGSSQNSNLVTVVLHVHTVSLLALACSMNSLTDSLLYKPTNATKYFHVLGFYSAPQCSHCQRCTI